MEKRTNTPKAIRTKVDLAFPTVVINTSGLKARRNRRRWNNYRFLGILVCCILFLVHMIDRTLLRLPQGETRLDLSHVKSIQDLSVDPIESWCLEGDDHDNCGCSNPLIAEGRQEDERWETVHHLNRDAFEEASKRKDLDVIFLGDSITEGWSGKFYGRLGDPRIAGVEVVFDELFSKQQNQEAHYEALAQGIAGDTTPNLLWRIQNGEIGRSSWGGGGGGNTASSLEEVGEEEEQQQQSAPLILWVLTGTNDLGDSGCSADMVLLGIVRIVEELRLRQPSAWVVVNGLLPRTYAADGFVMRSKGRLPVLYPTIRQINTELNRYAEQRDGVYYFETHAFFHNASVPDVQLRIDQELMTDFLIPSVEGYRAWGTEIVMALDSLLANNESTEG